MGIPSPWAQETAPETEVSASNWAPEPERERERAHAGAGGYKEDHDSATGAEGGEVVQFPRSTTEVAVRDQPGLPAKLKTASGVWMRDASQHATEVFNGSVYTARPPSVRDRVERWRRAEWAGDIQAVRIAGQVAGALPLALDVLVDIVRWFLTPGRFYMALAVLALVLILAF